MLPRAPEPAWSLGVLAGGRSTRMGEDKLALDFHGRTLLDHVVSRCAPRNGEVLIAWGPRARAERPLAVPVRGVTDVGEDLGPAGGLLALRRAARTPWLVVIAGDMPFLDRDLLALLVWHAAEAAATCAVWSRDGRPEPLPQALGPASAGELEAAISSGRLALFGWADRPLVIGRRAAGPLDAFANVNDPAAYRLALALFGGPGPR